LEWSFGCWHDEERSGSGVVNVEPKQDPGHCFRQTVKLPNTKLSKAEVAELIEDLRLAFPGSGYDLLRRNCCHFADVFCQRLGVGRIPGWIYRLARIGARIDWVLRPAQSYFNLKSCNSQSCNSAPKSGSVVSYSVQSKHAVQGSVPAEMFRSVSPPVSPTAPCGSATGYGCERDEALHQLLGNSARPPAG
ncbi:unnamed protein product, partial [Polarella glacialis]